MLVFPGFWVVWRYIARFMGHVCEVSHELWVRYFDLAMGLLNEDLLKLWVDFGC